MVCKTRIFCLMVLALLLPAVAVAQTPPSTKTPVAPKTEQIDPKCAESGAQTTVGEGGEIDTQRQDGKENLSDKLARSGGVICPPEHVDPEIRQPTPQGGNMPVIPPPGSPGGDQSVQPKLRGTLKFAPPIACRCEYERLRGASVRPWHGRRIAHHVAGIIAEL